MTIKTSFVTRKNDGIISKANELFGEDNVKLDDKYVNIDVELDGTLDEGIAKFCGNEVTYKCETIDLPEGLEFYNVVYKIEVSAEGKETVKKAVKTKPSASYIAYVAVKLILGNSPRVSGGSKKVALTDEQKEAKKIEAKIIDYIFAHDVSVEEAKAAILGEQSDEPVESAEESNDADEIMEGDY